MTSYIVLDIKERASSHLGALSRHCSERTPDGVSAIDPARSHLNQRLYGDGDTLNDCLANWYNRTKSKRPAKQAETPYFTFVLGASPEFFAASPDNLPAFVETAQAWAKETFGDDMVFAELHLDETTPHIHLVVAPTYERKPRIPGKQKKGETAEEFEARREAARNGAGERTVSRTSSRYAGFGTYEAMRRRFAEIASPLGLEYGEELTLTAPAGKSKDEHLKQHKAALNEKERELAQREESLKSKETLLAAHHATMTAKLKAMREEIVQCHASLGQREERFRGYVQKVSVNADRKLEALDAALVEAETAISEAYHARHKVLTAVVRFDRAITAVRSLVPAKVWQLISGALAEMREALSIAAEVLGLSEKGVEQVKSAVQEKPAEPAEPKF